jgi:biopolymer transport protein ExbB
MMNWKFGPRFLACVLAALLVTSAAGAQTSAPPAAETQAVSPQPQAAQPPPRAAPPAETAAPAPAAPTEILPPVASLPTVENPYGFEALWQGGDIIARGTLIALLIMSMGTWYVLIVKLIEQTVLFAQMRQAERGFRGGNLASLGARSVFRRMADEGFAADEQHRSGALADIDRSSWIMLSLQRSLDGIGNRLQRGLALLATVGSTAPFVGLFGTVWGIYHALTAIGIAGQASIDKVAGPVGEALIMTAMGLAVAVPAVLGYNWMVRRNKVALDRARSFAADLHIRLLGGAPHRRGA